MTDWHTISTYCRFTARRDELLDDKNDDNIAVGDDGDGDYDDDGDGDYHYDDDDDDSM